MKDGGKICLNETSFLHSTHVEENIFLNKCRWAVLHSGIDGVVERSSEDKFLPQRVHRGRRLLVLTSFDHRVSLAYLIVHQGQDVKDVMTETHSQ